MKYLPIAILILATFMFANTTNGQCPNGVCPTATFEAPPQRFVYRSRTVTRPASSATFYRQRWTVAGGNSNIANHLSSPPHNFNVRSMTRTQMFQLHDSHHDRIGPVSFVGNSVVFGANRVMQSTRRIQYRFRTFRVRAFQRVYNFRQRLRSRLFRR